MEIIVLPTLFSQGRPAPTTSGRFPLSLYPTEMYSTQGIEAIATVTELRSKTSALIEQAKSLKTGIMIQKNNEPEAVLISYDLYLKLYRMYEKKGK